MPFDKEFYDADYDPEVDHYEYPKCNECGESLKPTQIDGDVCQDCYDLE